MKLIMAGSAFPLGDLDEHPLSRCHSETYDGGYRWEIQLGTARLIMSRHEARYLMKFWDAIKAIETLDESTADMYDHKMQVVHALEKIKQVHDDVTSPDLLRDIAVAEQVGRHQHPIRHVDGWPEWLHGLVTFHNTVIGTPDADAVETMHRTGQNDG